MQQLDDTYHVLAAPNNDIFYPVFDIQETFLVESSQISSLKPSVLRQDLVRGG